MFELLSNSLKYSRFKLRKPEFPCMPKGPDVKQAKTQNLLVAGNHLSINLPRHAPIDSVIPQLKPKRDMILDFPSEKAGKGVYAEDKWRFSPVIRRQWRFNGPWFSGPVGCISFGITGISYKNDMHDVSLFHPKAQEHAIADYLISLYGHESRDGTALWKAPVNWRIKTGLPVPSASFDIVPREEGETSYNCILPVADNYLLFVSFVFIQDCTGLSQKRDEKISRAPMYELVNNILDSMTLTLSPDNQAKVDKIKAECPDYSLSETFPPLRWPVDSNTADQSPELLKIHSS